MIICFLWYFLIFRPILFLKNYFECHRSICLINSVLLIPLLPYFMSFHTIWHLAWNAIKRQNAKNTIKCQMPYGIKCHKLFIGHNSLAQIYSAVIQILRPSVRIHMVVLAFTCIALQNCGYFALLFESCPSWRCLKLCLYFFQI